MMKALQKYRFERKLFFITAGLAGTLLSASVVSAQQICSQPSNSAAGLTNKRHDHQRFINIAVEEGRWKKYWKGILHRLAGDDLNAFLGTHPQVRILSTPRPNAYAGDTNQVFISSGLLALVEDEAELAFILAHELAHFKLNHSADEASGSARGAQKLVEQEVAADMYALQLMREGGFDPAAGLSILSKLRHFGRSAGSSLEETHPSLTLRFEAMDSRLSSDKGA